jgi:hypothetical protein
LSCFICKIKRTNTCSSPISGCERPNSHCLIAPHSNNHRLLPSRVKLLKR